MSVNHSGILQIFQTFYTKTNFLKRILSTTAELSWRRPWITIPIPLPFRCIASSQLNLIKIALIQIEANGRTMNPNKTATLGKVTRLTVVIHHFGCISIGMLRRTNWKPVEFHEVIPRNRHLQFHDLFSCLSTLIKKKIVVDIGALFSAFLQHMLETSGSDIPCGGE